ncbi:MAG: thiamine pyrophosphate-binding protein [Burkholderiaceae bacterium]|nr:thiamine pyrophosphate-binding protein [Burkholderiaceae bacterium]
MATQSGAQIVQDFLACNDIEYVFGNPGTTETTFLAALAGAKTQYILALHESSATGIAAGYALIKNKPAVVNIHTYPGLANALFNMKNAHDAGIPLLVIAGQQDTRFLIHNPVLSAPNTELAKTATKYAYEVNRIEDLSIAFQRCYVQAGLEPRKPVFLSIPMDLMASETDQVCFRKTRIIDDVVSESIEEVAAALKAVPKGKLAIAADYAVGASDAIAAMTAVAHKLGADIYSAPFHVQGVVDPIDPNYCGQIPATTSDINALLSKYDTLLLLGEKIDTFLYTGKSAFPMALKVIHISPTPSQLGFDYPVDLAVVGNLRCTLEAISKSLGDSGPIKSSFDAQTALAGVRNTYSTPDRDPSDKVIVEILAKLDHSTHIVTEGSSEDAIVQDISVKLGYRNVHFSPRGGGLGWAMPLATGMSLATSEHSVCFVGDGGSLFSIHAIWTAAKYKIPVIFICFVNHEYRILKDLWCKEKGVDFATTNFIGLDFTDPNLDLAAIAAGFGARIDRCNEVDNVQKVLDSALAYQGPTMIFVERRT